MAHSIMYTTQWLTCESDLYTVLTTSTHSMAVDQGLLAVTGGSAAKRLAEGLEVIDPGPVHCHSPLSFLSCVVHNVVFSLRNHGT